MIISCLPAIESANDFFFNFNVFGASVSSSSPTHPPPICTTCQTLSETNCSILISLSHQESSLPFNPLFSQLCVPSFITLMFFYFFYLLNRCHTWVYMAVRFAVALPENCNESLSTNHLAASKQDGGCPSIGHVAVCVPAMKSVDRENCYRSQQSSSTMYFCEHGLRAGWTMDGERKEMTKVHHTTVCVTDCHLKLCGFCGQLDVSSRKNIHFPPFPYPPH